MVKFQDIKGLTDKEVEASREKNGSNELPPREIESFFDKLKDNFEDPIIRILMVALGITIFLAFLGYTDWIEGFGIFVAVFLATFVATYSEYKNENSFRDLQELASRIENTVFRNGKPIKVLASQIVAGDYVLLQAGDKVPADGKLVSGELMVLQASLSGEQDPVRKIPCTVDNYATDKLEKEIFADPYLCFRDSVIDDGEAVLKVDSVGKNTEYGKLAEELADNETRDSPLQVKLNDLADGVARFGYTGATLIAISFLFKQIVIDNKYSFDAIKNYISLSNRHVAFHDIVTCLILAIIVIVVAVPEGLPMMIAIVLSLNMRKLLKANVLVRKLLGIEAAGSLNILFVDKTGTLTRGVFEPQMFISGHVKPYQKIDQVPEELANILTFCLKESTSVVLGGDGALIGGNASDRAILSFVPKNALKLKSNTDSVKEILFNSARKFSAVHLAVNKDKPRFLTSNEIVIIKGAPDLILPNCASCYDEQGKQVPLKLDPLMQEMDQISQTGTRVIAVATAAGPLGDDLPSKLTLVGIIGIVDDIRQESKPAIEIAQKAGIQVVMITGDRKETAMSVASQIGLLKEGKSVITSTQLKALTDKQLQEMIPNLAVIARALPTDKSRLVKVCQEINMVVGMTGDGVNDSSALLKADVGFAMGGGSEVAKEASDIVILDDNFKSITQAILYGRTIFKSIRKFIVFQSTVNAASLLIVFVGPFLGIDFPLTLIQLLWVNLVMDTFAAMAFGGEPALLKYMHENPIPRDERIISAHMWSSILINGVFIATLCILSLTFPFARSLFTREGVPSEPVFLTAFFAFFIFLTAFNAFNVRTPSTINIFDHLFENQGFVMVITLIFVVQVIFTYVGGRVLRTVGLTTNEWGLVIGAASIIIPWDMIRKTVVHTLLPPPKSAASNERKKN